MGMKIFELTHYDYDGNSQTLWTHESKEQEQFKEDCEWIIRTHIEQLFKEEEEGYFARIASDEIIELIEDNLPKLGYEQVIPTYYALKWTNRAEDILGEILDAQTLEKLIEHNNNKKGR